MKSLLLFPLLACSFAISGCVVPNSYAPVGPAPGYYAGNRVDFYYSSGRPYSYRYGALVTRDGRYYYRRGGRYVAYSGPTRAYAPAPRYRSVPPPGYRGRPPGYYGSRPGRVIQY
ncbi:MAG: hypothetical protein ABI680_16690 [Chthoniobacteraceae bacterium]